uniref:YTH domain-containing protein n=1 Tax=Cucumis melo TaxID=3656 RepID=A0A9I9EJY2_CUCME
MKTFSSLSIVVVSVRPSLYSSSLSSHDFPRIFYFSASISQTCNLLASSNLSPSSTWVLLRVLCLPARLSTAIRHLKLMIRGNFAQPLSVFHNISLSHILRPFSVVFTSTYYFGMLSNAHIIQVMVVYNPLGWIRNDVVRIPRGVILLKNYSILNVDLLNLLLLWKYPFQFCNLFHSSSDKDMACEKMMSRIGGSVSGSNWKYAHGTAYYGQNFSLKWLKVNEMCLTRGKKILR